MISKLSNLSDSEKPTLPLQAYVGSFEHAEAKKARRLMGQVEKLAGKAHQNEAPHTPQVSHTFAHAKICANHEDQLAFLVVSGKAFQLAQILQTVLLVTTFRVCIACVGLV